MSSQLSELHPRVRNLARQTKMTAAFILLMTITVSIWIQWPRIQLWRLGHLAARTHVNPHAGRLVGFGHGTGRKRSTAPEDASELRVAAKRIVRAFDGSTTGERVHAAGVGFLLSGNPRRAVSELSRAAQKPSAAAATWNDLAVARLAAYETEENVLELINALGAVEAALCRDPYLVEARFNRALILERMGLHAPAARAYDDYLAIDGHSEWATEARMHRRGLSGPTRADEWKSEIVRLRRASAANDRNEIHRIVSTFPQDSRATAETIVLDEWALATESDDSAAADAALKLADTVGEALVATTGESLLRDSVVAIQREHDRSARVALATAVRQYVAARRVYEKREVTKAAPLFESAKTGFGRLGHPMAALAEFYVACALFDSGSNHEALDILTRLSRNVPPSQRALHAFIQWEIGVIHGRAGRFNDALDAQLQSIAIFDRLGEQGNANVVRSQAAGTQSSLGRHVEAWRIRLEIFGRISNSGDPGDLQRALDQAARTEAREGQWENAFALMSLAGDSALQINPRIRVSTLNWRALAGHRLGFESVASADLAAAHLASTKIRDRKMRRQAQNEITFCEAIISRASDPRRAIALLNAYLDEHEGAASAALAAEALLERGRAWVSLGDDVHASRDLHQSLGIAQAEGFAMRSEQLHDAYFRTAESVARELADLLVRQHRVNEAFNVLEAQRSQTYVIGNPLGRPAGRPVLQYVVLADHILIFVSSGSDITVKRVGVSEKNLAEAADAFRSQLERGGEAEAVGILSTLLIEPVATVIRASHEIVVVPDGPIARIPFSALLVDDNRTVVDYVAVTIAPSAAVAADREQRAVQPAVSVLVVGNPSFDRQRFPDLEPLPAAEREASWIARVYSHATALLRSDATKDRVLKAFGTTDVVHLATHAETVSYDPARSRLILAPAGYDSGVLTLSEIERSSLRNTRLVVAAGCATATPSEERRNVDTLAIAFVAAGASSAIGTLWSVDDAATEVFMRRLHREITRGRSAAEAVRHAQVAMRSGNEPAFRRIEAWGGFQVYGSGK